MCVCVYVTRAFLEYVCGRYIDDEHISNRYAILMTSDQGFIAMIFLPVKLEHMVKSRVRKKSMA